MSSQLYMLHHFWTHVIVKQPSRWCWCVAVYCTFLRHITLPSQIDAKRDQLSDAKRELKSAKADAKVRKDEKSKKWVWKDLVWINCLCLVSHVNHGAEQFAVLVLCRAVETKKKAVQRIEEQLMKLEVQATDREENKQIALGTSKLNYLDPRISVAWYDHIIEACWDALKYLWLSLESFVLYNSCLNFCPVLSTRCKKWGIPVEKIYNKTQREKFAWAIDMADEDFEF